MALESVTAWRNAASCAVVIDPTSTREYPIASDRRYHWLASNHSPEFNGISADIAAGAPEPPHAHIAATALYVTGPALRLPDRPQNHRYPHRTRPPALPRPLNPNP